MIRAIKEHKVVVIVGVVLLTIFISWSVWQYNNRQALLASEEAAQLLAEEQQTAEQQQAAAEEAEPATEASEATKVAETNANLSEEQKLLIEGYGEKEKAFLAILEANLWLELTKNSNLTFADNSFTEISGAKQVVVPFAIMHVAPNMIEGEGAVYESQIAMIKTKDGKISFMKIQRSKQSGKKAGTWHIFCEAFTLGEDYYRSKPSKLLKIDKLEESAASQLGGKKGIDEAIAEYVSVAYPAAKTATWDGLVETDWEKKVATTQFSLDIKPVVKLTLTYNMDTKKYEVK